MPPEVRATYRIQLRPNFGFAEAADLVPYLRALAVSHIYLSPVLTAVEGSQHGYDVVDPTAVRRELGGERGLRNLARVARAEGLGLILDLVPNHMAIAGRQNPWWWDVLENGAVSRFAHFFDVDWENLPERFGDQILLPVLGDHYGRVLEGGGIRLERKGPEFTLAVTGQVFPVDPRSLAIVLERAAQAGGGDTLAFLAGAARGLPALGIDPREAEIRYRDQAVLGSFLARVLEEDPIAATAVDEEIRARNADPDLLDEFVSLQNYRLTFWRAADRDLGYRRFFDINNLVGLRVEDEDVFQATHALPLALVREGSIDGFRVDHVDGLRNPTRYLARLREAAPDAYIVVEKILMPGERLPGDWPVEGTTGYDFLYLLDGIFVDPSGDVPLTNLLEELTGEDRDFATIAEESKRYVLTERLGSELNRLAALFVLVCERHRRHRDYTRHELYGALLETAVAFPVYRTYVRAKDGTVSEVDARRIREATARASRARPDLPPDLFGFLADLLLLGMTGNIEDELAMRFQQLTVAAMAKGIEDTAGYRYGRLLAGNEVGGDPGRFGVSPTRFHAAMERSAKRTPSSLLAGSTHDTKRSEDVRARLTLLSQTPDRWEVVVRGFFAAAEPHRKEGFPDPDVEYLFFQTLVGAWPISRNRARKYMEKAAREAGVHTFWTRPDERYETALSSFVESALGDPAFVSRIESFVGEIAPAARDEILARTLIRMTAPGVPDIYQGTETVDLSLVDPDNRRPVDFLRRARLLLEADGASPEEFLGRADDGFAKLEVIKKALSLRRERPELFGPGSEYRPLPIRGEKAEHALAFLRGGRAATVVPRLVLSRAGDFKDTTVELPPGKFANRMTGDSVAGGDQRLDDLLARFPVALLVREERP